jgi:hypothetical protein
MWVTKTTSVVASAPEFGRTLRSLKELKRLAMNPRNNIVPVAREHALATFSIAHGQAGVGSEGQTFAKHRSLTAVNRAGFHHNVRAAELRETRTVTDPHPVQVGFCDHHSDLRRELRRHRCRHRIQVQSDSVMVRNRLLQQTLPVSPPLHMYAKIFPSTR